HAFIRYGRTGEEEHDAVVADVPLAPEILARVMILLVCKPGKVDSVVDHVNLRRLASPPYQLGGDASAHCNLRMGQSRNRGKISRRQVQSFVPSPVIQRIAMEMY